MPLDDKVARPDYMLVLEETPRLGKVCLLLYEHGQMLFVTRVGTPADEAVSKLIGQEVKRGDYDFSTTKIIKADPTMPIFVGGSWKDLSDIAEGLYAHLIETLELEDKVKQLPKPRFPFALFGLNLALLTPVCLGQLITDYFDIPKIPYYVIAETLVGAAVLKLVIKTFKDKKQALQLQLVERQFKLRYDAIFAEFDTVRKSLLQAGVIKGMFPPEYGLR